MNLDFVPNIPIFFLYQCTNICPFLDLNIKVIDDDIHRDVYDQRGDFGFPIVNLP